MTDRYDVPTPVADGDGEVSLLSWPLPALVMCPRRCDGRRMVEAPIVLPGPLTVDSVEQALAEAAREERRVRLSRYAQPRLTYLYGSQRSAVGHLELAIGGPIVAISGALAVLATTGLARGDEPDG